RDAYPGQVGRGRPPVRDVPVDLERVGELVAQEAEARHLHGEAVAVRLDVDDLDLEQVARLGALDVDRTGERVHDVEVRRGDGIQGRVRGHLPVERVPRLQHHLVAGLAPDQRWDVGVPPVVAGVR